MVKGRTRNTVYSKRKRSFRLTSAHSYSLLYNEVLQCKTYPQNSVLTVELIEVIATDFTIVYLGH